MASKNVINLTTANWDAEVTKSEQPVMVDFWAVWCGPCRMLSPTIDKLADQFAGKAKVAKLNTDESPEIATRYNITSIPRVLFFKGGDEPKASIVGVNAENAYVSALNRLLDG
jgi:thioredoxin 1